MPKHPRLTKRGNVYWHRAAIPADIRGTYPKSEETFSLKTTDPREALRLVRIRAAEVDQRFAEHRARQNRPILAELSQLQIKRLGELYYAMLLGEDEAVRGEQFEGRTFEEYSEDIDALDADNRHQFARGEVDDFFRDEAADLLTWDGVDLNLDHASVSFRMLCREVQAATIRAADAKRRRNKGDVVETPILAPDDTRREGPLLSTVVSKWVEEKGRSAWVPKVRAENEAWMGQFKAVVGDRPLTTYSKSDGRAFKDTLVKLPPNWSKRKELKGLPIDEAARCARTLDMPRMSEANINKIMYGLSGFFSWAADNYVGVERDVFKGLRLKVKKRAREQRDPFTPDELQKIFTAPIFTGCKSERFWKEPGPLVLRESARYWTPLVGLFTGAREGEILQLYVGDVRTEKGVPYLWLSPEGEDQRIKTKQARAVPVHRTLIALGFLEHVARRRDQGEQRVFPDAPMGADGYYSSPFSKFFNANFLPSIGVKRPKIAFHSFRHNFEDACRRSGVEMGARYAMVGHAESGQGGRYGGEEREYSIPTLNAELQKVAYPALDLSYLRGL